MLAALAVTDLAVTLERYPIFDDCGPPIPYIALNVIVAAGVLTGLTSSALGVGAGLGRVKATGACVGVLVLVGLVTAWASVGGLPALGCAIGG